MSDWREGKQGTLGIPGSPSSYGLSDPVVLWDTRTVDDFGDPVVNGGTAGSSFDLDAGDVYGVAGTDLLATMTASVIGTGANLPWSTVGGDHCDGPWTAQWAFGYVGLGGGGTFRAQVRLNTRGGGDEDLNADAAITVTTGDDYSGYAEIETPSDFEVISHAISSDGFGQVDLRCTMLTVTWDPATEQCYVWHNLDFVPWETYDDIFFQRFGGMLPCQEATVEDDIDTFAGTLSRLVAVSRRAGYAWPGGVGFALFRGLPTSDDLGTWLDYWYPSGQQYQPDAVFGASMDRTGLDVTDPHSDSWTVPSGAGPVVLIDLTYADGGDGSEPSRLLRFEVSASAGDVFDVELGAAGGDTSIGTGGWPDGGDGGLNSGTGLYGFGGGGSTKVYLNSSLIIHIGGGGGGAISSSGPVQGTRPGHPTQLDDTVPGNGSGLSIFGQGGQEGAPGSGSAEGGTGGSGSDGGSGEAIAVAFGSVTGGGGGGGGFFGGGGGGYVSPSFGTHSSGSGGAGSSWIDTGPIVGTRHNLTAASAAGDATVDFIYDPAPVDCPP